MSKIIEHVLIPLFVVISVLYTCKSFGGDSISLNKVYHHTTQNPLCLEQANISFYFSGEPKVQEIKNNNNDNSESFSFFFPKAVISKGECQEMVNRLNNYNDCYTVNMTEVTRPTRGIMLVVHIDPHKFALSYEQFDSIGLQKGFVFRLYNKEVLKKLEQANNQPVLRTLWYTGDKIVKPCIAIDSGHGGVDSGAVGCDGVQEKDICLAIGTMVGNVLEQHGFSVVLTRKSDYFVGLDERTLCANNNCADLCISIHANYAANPRVLGIETFYLQPYLLKQSFSQLSDQDNNCVMSVRKQRADVSYKLAESIQHHVCDAVLSFHDEKIDRKVKCAVSQLLFGAQMPSVLVEVGFVSHKKEAALLHNIEYQNCVARGICNGILSIIRS
jgi:N-acetylmuramoyl-L-alanine amidase